MIGIYKITNPKGRIYIGQSIDIEKRWIDYKRLRGCDRQVRLYRSFMKHGVDKHKFEVLCECETDKLNELERYYQDLYSSTNNFGLNCILTSCETRSGKSSPEMIEKQRISAAGRRHSPESLKKIGDASRGRKKSPETIEKLKASLRGRIPSQKTIEALRASRIGKKHTPEAIEKMRASKIGKKATPEAIENMKRSRTGLKRSKEAIEKTANKNRGRKRTPEQIEVNRLRHLGFKHKEESKLKMSLSRKGVKHSLTHSENIGKAQKGKKHPPERCKKNGENHSKIVFDFVNGIFYSSIKEAAEVNNISLSTLKNRLRGVVINKTNFIYG